MIGRKNNDRLRGEIAELSVLIQSQANAIQALHASHNRLEHCIGNNSRDIQALRLETDHLKKALLTKNETIELLESVLSELRQRNKRAEQKVVKLKRKLKGVIQTKKGLEAKYLFQNSSN